MQIDIVEIIWNKPPWFRLTLQLFSSIEIHPLKMTFRYLFIYDFLSFKAIRATLAEAEKLCLFVVTIPYCLTQRVALI